MMADTTNYTWPLPDPTGIQQAEIQRIADALGLADGDVKALADLIAALTFEAIDGTIADAQLPTRLASSFLTSDANLMHGTSGFFRFNGGTPNAPGPSFWAVEQCVLPGGTAGYQFAASLLASHIAPEIKIRTRNDAGGGFSTWVELYHDGNTDHFARQDTVNTFAGDQTINGDTDINGVLNIATSEVTGINISFQGVDEGYIKFRKSGSALASFIQQDFTIDALNLVNNVSGTTLSIDTVTTIDGNKVWHAGNDGAGSGLDADLLDGQHGTYYRSLGNATDILALANGGTGATTKAAARTALEVPSITDLTGKLAKSDNLSDLDDSALAAWEVQPIGVPIPVLDNLVGVAAPPTDQAYRYIKLTASDAYNTGVLNSEGVSGTAPLVVATAVINLAGSPLDGQTINLINTERRSLRGGSAGAVENDQMQQIIASLSHGMHAVGGVSSMFNNYTGAFSAGASGSIGYAGPAGTAVTAASTDFDSANSPNARVGNETRSKNIGVTYFMRVK